MAFSVTQRLCLKCNGRLGKLNTGLITSITFRNNVSDANLTDKCFLFNYSFNFKRRSPSKISLLTLHFLLQFIYFHILVFDIVKN